MTLIPYFLLKMLYAQEENLEIELVIFSVLLVLVAVLNK